MEHHISHISVEHRTKRYRWRPNMNSFTCTFSIVEQIVQLRGVSVSCLTDSPIDDVGCMCILGWSGSRLSGSVSRATRRDVSSRACVQSTFSRFIGTDEGSAPSVAARQYHRSISIAIRATAPAFVLERVSGEAVAAVQSAGSLGTHSHAHNRHGGQLQHPHLDVGVFLTISIAAALLVT